MRATLPRSNNRLGSIRPVTAITLAADLRPRGRTAPDALVVGVERIRSGALALASGALDVPDGRAVLAALRALGATGRVGECHGVPLTGPATIALVMAVGLGDRPARGRAHDAEVVRRAAGAAVRSLAGRRRVAVGLPTPEGGDPVRAAADGALLGAYAFDRYRTTSRADHAAPVESITLVVPDPGARAATRALKRAVAVADAVRATRDLVNTPPNDLHPREFAEYASEQADRWNLEIEILDEKALRKGRYGGILAVGQGSANPPRLVRVAYRPARPVTSIALVGKGITFDSGGLSLKPSASMVPMKSDMGGAAAVVNATVAIARLKLPVAVTAWAALAENMPSGGAQRPSDVLTTYGGKTVEVLNTDAEGRLVLADALVRAGEDRPDVIVDVATLTGAQGVALGTHVSAVMGNDDELRSRVIRAAGRAGEPMWPMPLPSEARKSLDSQIADIANMGETTGGMLVAGLFLRDFVPARDGVAIPWAHLDIAAPAFNEGAAHGFTPKGGTGAAVATLVQLAEDLAQQPR
jgi:leucyl aminopeptidase